MKKINIVKKSDDYNRIIKQKNGISNNYFILNSENNSNKITQFGITFVKNIGNAVTRNKLKRRIKSIIDNNKDMYEENKTYIIISKKTALELNYQQLEQEIKDIFNKIKNKGE